MGCTGRHLSSSQHVFLDTIWDTVFSIHSDIQTEILQYFPLALNLGQCLRKKSLLRRPKVTPKLSLGSQDPTPKKVAILPKSLYELQTPGADAYSETRNMALNPTRMATRTSMQMPVSVKNVPD